MCTPHRRATSLTRTWAGCWATSGRSAGCVWESLRRLPPHTVALVGQQPAPHALCASPQWGRTDRRCAPVPQRGCSTGQPHSSYTRGVRMIGCQAAWASGSKPRGSQVGPRSPGRVPLPGSEVKSSMLEPNPGARRRRLRRPKPARPGSSRSMYACVATPTHVGAHLLTCVRIRAHGHTCTYIPAGIHVHTHTYIRARAHSRAYVRARAAAYVRLGADARCVPARGHTHPNEPNAIWSRIRRALSRARTQMSLLLSGRACIARPYTRAAE